MSITGQQQLELEQARREQIRLGQVRDLCGQLAAACDAALAAVREPAVQQLAAASLRPTAAELATCRRGIDGSPDATLVQLRAVHERTHAAVAEAESVAQNWTANQATLVGQARAARDKAGSGVGDGALTTRAVDAERHARAGRLDDARRILTELTDATASAQAADLDERVRREVVRCLLDTLRNMGFVVAPRLDNNAVVLDGRLASGRQARFEVQLDGKMSFDLDGYEGRACADDMQKVEANLRNRFGITLGPPQVVWKNPDRLSQGARPLPSSADSNRRR